MSLPRIGIVISTTRDGRFGDKPAAWIREIGAQRDDLELEIVDLRDHPLAHFGDPHLDGPGTAARWADRIGALDGYIFVTAEYNHSFPGVLKNALDHTYRQFSRKPAAFIGYGGVGGARAIEQLRLVLVEMQVAPLRSAVHIGGEAFLAAAQGKPIAEFPHLTVAAGAMLDELAWWTASLKAGREGVRLERLAPQVAT